ncbi:MAG: glycosyltransferase [Candidatus Melainabacteria bacterium]|nr:glycosyltransferase [Candidatus Melainabacteria bacterium]
MTKAIFTVAIIGLTIYAALTAAAPLGITVELAITVSLLAMVSVLARGKDTIRFTFVVASIAQLRYLIWRLNCTIGFDNALDNLAAALFIMADVYCTLMVLGTTFAYWFREPDDRVFDFDIPSPPTRMPLVDVFITTYREPPDVLRRTIAGAKSISYANKAIYLLDDGNLDENRTLTDEMGINYINRVDNTNFKAGNVNNALAQTKGEFILVLDADHICASTIIDYAIPTFLADQKIAVVQFAQRAINPSVIDRTLRYRGFATDLSAVNFVYLPSQKFWDAILWGGSGALLRRTALAEIGGVSTGSVTEDVHTSFTLFDHGWKISYVPLPQILALSPENLSALLTQQKRWFAGALQLNFGVKYWLYQNLTIPQRVIQMFNFLGFWSFLPRLIWIFCPIVLILFHIIPARMQPLEFLIGWLPLFYLCVRGNLLVARNNLSIVILDLFDTLKGPALLWQGLTMFMNGLAQPFQVTPKGNKDPSHSDFRLCIPYAILLVLAAGAACSFLINKISHPDFSILLLTFSWYYVFLLAGSVCIALEKPQPMSMHVVPCDLNLTVSFRQSQVEGRLCRVSECGGTIALPGATKIDCDAPFEIALLNGQGDWRQRVRFIGRRELENDVCLIDVSFIPEQRSTADFINFIRLTICENKAWQSTPSLHTSTAMTNVIETPFRQLSSGLRRLASHQVVALSVKPKRCSSIPINIE